MPCFTGEYSYALDEKGRVKIPSAFKDELAPDENATVILVRDREACIAVYTPEEYQNLMNWVATLNRDDLANRHVIRRHVSSSFRVPVDAQGRIKIPAELIKAARLEKGGEVKVAGFMEYIQIWNPEEYLKSMDK